jgi:hypothetical protein
VLARPQIDLYGAGWVLGDCMFPDDVFDFLWHPMRAELGEGCWRHNLTCVDIPVMVEWALDLMLPERIEQRVTYFTTRGCVLQSYHVLDRTKKHIQPRLLSSTNPTPGNSFSIHSKYAFTSPTNSNTSFPHL